MQRVLPWTLSITFSVALSFPVRSSILNEILNKQYEAICYQPWIHKLSMKLYKCPGLIWPWPSIYCGQFETKGIFTALTTREFDISSKVRLLLYITFVSVESAICVFLVKMGQSMATPTICLCIQPKLRLGILTVWSESLHFAQQVATCPM